MLVICDYATRYPEAIALCSIDAEDVAEELIKVFSRVVVPQEILTDQGVISHLNSWLSCIGSCTSTLSIPAHTTSRQTASGQEPEETQHKQL